MIRVEVTNKTSWTGKTYCSVLAIGKLQWFESETSSYIVWRARQAEGGHTTTGRLLGTAHDANQEARVRVLMPLPAGREGHGHPAALQTVPVLYSMRCLTWDSSTPFIAMDWYLYWQGTRDNILVTQIGQCSMLWVCGSVQTPWETFSNQQVTLSAIPVHLHSGTLHEKSW